MQRKSQGKDHQKLEMAPCLTFPAFWPYLISVMPAMLTQHTALQNQTCYVDSERKSKLNQRKLNDHLKGKGARRKIIELKVFVCVCTLHVDSTA